VLDRNIKLESFLGRSPTEGMPSYGGAKPRLTSGGSRFQITF